MEAQCVGECNAPTKTVEEAENLRPELDEFVGNVVCTSPSESFLTNAGRHLTKRQYRLCQMVNAVTDLEFGKSSSDGNFVAVPDEGCVTEVSVCDMQVQASDMFVELGENAGSGFQSFVQELIVRAGTIRTQVRACVELSCNKSTQTDGDGFSSNEGDVDLLVACFPTISLEDLKHVYTTCGNDLRWTVNLLLDSGYECGVSTPDHLHDIQSEDCGASLGGIKEEGVATKEPPISIESEQSPSRGNNVEATTEEKCVSEPSDALNRSEPPTDQEKSSASNVESSGETTTLILELSADMAMQLQDLFGPLFEGVPSDLLSPDQLKVEVSVECARQIFLLWLNTQHALRENSGECRLQGALLAKSCRTKITASDADSNTGSFGGMLLADEELAKEMSQFENQKKQCIGIDPNSLLARLRLKRLFSMFPSIEKNFVTMLFIQNRCLLDETAVVLVNLFNIPPVEEAANEDVNSVEDSAETVNSDDL
ncbi:unnamed protein product [Soboliphyme baturini]|uniref:CUE domain-containing protein n=1 Tax=Soboliphyme baturini TaxID=241478 RepID=A0A183IRM4_9BILA|nr:unnamed protein product [Soboliphyme baturini]